MEKDIELKVLDCVRKVVGETVESHHTLDKDLGFDSLDYMSLIFNLEEAFGIRFDEERFPFRKDVTVASVVEAVSSVLSAPA